ncbi:complex I subunit 5 family protein [Egicoccus halophilus]|uniref:Cation:proton antiporter n=1 Tax=Egicoccus halophilus TaxID=1670830 RepID=A0A8J3ET05_9ACTN|nr:proton-conducting transporter membrane subunit [Egicoccus halophilus]GGI04605.1 cation:proton antiporter [Egicoccus halophilus]
MADAGQLLPLLVALPLLGAALTRVPVVDGTRYAPDVVAILTAAGTTVVGVLATRHAMDGPLVHHLGEWRPIDGLPVGVPFVADPVAAGFVTLISALITAAFVHFAVAGARGGGLTHVLTALLLAAANGFVLAGDLFTMFVFLELMGITVYAITAGKTDDPAALPAAMNMAVTSTVGAVLLLSGVGLLHGQLGTPNLGAVAETLTPGAWGAGAALAIGLVVAGLSVKAGLVPFHFAHADLHTATTVQHAGLFGAILLPLGLYGIARIDRLALGGDVHGPVAQVLLVGGASTAVLAGVMSLCQNQLKRLLAFSSVSHLGIAAAGVGLSAPEATAAVATYVLGHAPMKLGLLLVAGLALHHYGELQLADLSGRWQELPVMTVLLAVGGLALAGLPPSGLYAGKAALSKAAEDAGASALVPVLYLAAVLTGAAVLRFVTHLVTGWPVPDDPLGKVAEDHPEPAAHLPRTFVVVPAVLLATGLLVPLVPGTGAALATAAGWFHDQPAHVAVLLGREGVWPRPVVEPLLFWEASSLATGALAAVAAGLGGVAAARWRGRREPGRLGAPVRALRAVHTAHVGEYTAWLTAGVGVVVGWIVLTGRGSG